MIVVWVVEQSWPAAIDAARELLPDDAPVTLLHVVAADVGAAAGGALLGLLRRGRAAREPAGSLTAAAAAAAENLLGAAQERLGRPATRMRRAGRVEREVVAACARAAALVVARDGDLSRIGPASLGHTTRFVVDHAPCPVLLVWPGVPPGLDTLPRASRTCRRTRRRTAAEVRVDIDRVSCANAIESL